MNATHSYTNQDLFCAMVNYDNAKRHRFTLIDLAVMETIISGAYTTDTELARIALCSLSTIKRSINKLCDFGFIKKHSSHDNTKTIELDQEMLDLFLDTYYHKQAGDI